MRTITAALCGLCLSATVATAQSSDSVLMSAHDELEMAVKNFQTGVEELDMAAEDGSAPAQFYLGTMKIHGILMEEDIEGGLSLLKESAEAGYAPAEHSLGMHHFNGHLVALDRERAKVLMQRAHEDGYHPASGFVRALEGME